MRGGYLYLIAIILLAGWAIGFFIYHVGAIIHLLLGLGLISILIKMIRGPEKN
ncbi:MAG: lmo0937 family membrane protein [Chitinophagales bacterium]|nr:lmo0937 family membrane protein [Chitinophagales bacterium]